MKSINKEPGASAAGSFHKGGNRWLAWTMALPLWNVL